MGEIENIYNVCSDCDYRINYNKYLIFAMGMNDYEFCKFVLKRFNVNQCSLNCVLYFLNRESAEIFSNFLNTYMYHFNKNLHNKNSLEDNKVFFQEFYNSYKVMEKLCEGNT